MTPFKQTAFVLMLGTCLFAFSACDNKDDTKTSQNGTTTLSSSEPASGVSAGSEGIAVGEPNPATPEQPAACPHQDMVGKVYKKEDTADFKETIRVLYPDTPATMDYRWDRVNIILEKGTDKITEVRCG